VAPGYIADLIVVDDFQNFNVELVIKRGRIVAERGRPLFRLESADFAVALNTVQVQPLNAHSFRLAGKPGKVRVIGLVPNQVVTRHLWEEAPLRDGELVSDTARDILKIAVVERHASSSPTRRGTS